MVVDPTEVVVVVAFSVEPPHPAPTIAATVAITAIRASCFVCMLFVFRVANEPSVARPLDRTRSRSSAMRTIEASGPG